MEFIILNVFLGVIIFVSLIILWFILPPDSPWTPWWRTNSKKAVAAGRLAQITSRDLVYELGSGDANFLTAVSKKFGSQGYGIEFDYLRHLMARLNIYKNGQSKNIILKRGNFFDYKLTKATVIFVYLVPRVLEKLKPKLIQELKKGTRIISYRYKFKPNDKIKFIKSDLKNDIHLYKIV